MDSQTLVYYRKKLGLTQKELAQLLITSVKAVSSYEQGWRHVPENVERQILFLISRQTFGKGTLRPCWVQKNCPSERKKKCPAWKFKTGHLCWFISGTLCEGIVHKNWNEKIQVCKNCEVFKPILNF
jgi:DNA-binding XRE family transcriptional regulator